MPSRLETLQRLVTLYSTVEEMHSVELQRMTAAVREAERAVGIERELARAALVDGRLALLAGNCANRIVAETQQEISRWRQRALERIRIQREELSNAAMKQYVTSRLKREQLERLTDEIAAQLDTEEGRRIQAVSDDLFLVRKRWMGATKGDHGTINKMKVS
jgi:hypothetical protein